MTTFQKNCIACRKQFTTPILSTTGQLCATCAKQGLFRKKIIITGITRMNRGNVCVSGIDPDTWRFARPVFATGINRDFTMAGTTQVIRHFNLVEMEFKQYKPDQIYHTEDWVINENFAPRFIKHLTDVEIVQVLNRMSVTDLNAAMQPQDQSLFIVKAQRIISIWHEQWEKFKVRLSFVDQAGNIYDKIPVTDLLTLAFVRYQLNNGNTNYSNELMNAFNNNPHRYVRIGLTRIFQGQYWKQVTALITIPDLFDGNSFSYYENQIGGQA